MKFVSFNINGLRARYHQLNYIINNLKPDVIGLQETKVNDDIFPINKILDKNYFVYFNGKKQHSGVALLYRKQPITLKKGFNITNNPSYIKHRIIIADFIINNKLLTIINCYSPHGGNYYKKDKFLDKKKFYEYLINNIKYNYDYNNSLILIMGDMNISPTDLDVGLSKNTIKQWLRLGKCSFLKEERMWLSNLFDLGFVDIYRYKYKLLKINNCYSWFDYRFNSFKRNSGLRIDLLLASKKLLKFIDKTGIDYTIRAMKKPSDHTAVWVDINL